MKQVFHSTQILPGQKDKKWVGESFQDERRNVKRAKTERKNEEDRAGGASKQEYCVFSIGLMTLLTSALVSVAYPVC